MADLELAFSVEPVVGWRLWRVAREIDRWSSARDLATALLAAESSGERRPVADLFKPQLRSLTELGFWPARARLDAACGLDRDHAAPLVGCECGIWAFRARERAYAALLDYANGPMPLALGRVHLWGRIVEHDHGWRCQYGYPADLTIFGADEQVVEAVADTYGVPALAAPWPEQRSAA